MLSLTTLALVAALASARVAAIDYSDSVVRLQGTGGESRRGSAFLVDVDPAADSATFMTCGHVLIGCSGVRLFRLVDGGAVELPLLDDIKVAFDDPSDLALLRVRWRGDSTSLARAGLKPLPLASDRFGDNEDRAVETVGFPQFNEDNLLVSRGWLAARLDRAERDDLLSSAFSADAGYVVGHATARGMSGGPVWAVEEELVVGMHLGRLVDFAGVVVSSHELARFLAKPKFVALTADATDRAQLATSNRIAQQMYATETEVDAVRWGSFDLLDRLLGDTSGFRRLFQEIDLTPRLGVLADEPTLRVDVEVSDDWTASLFVDGREIRAADGTFAIDASLVATGEHLITLRVDRAEGEPTLNELFSTTELNARFSVGDSPRFRVVRALPKAFGGFSLYLSYHGPPATGGAAPIVELLLNGDGVTRILAESGLHTTLRPGSRRATFGTAELTARLHRDGTLDERAARLDPGWAGAVHDDPSSPCLLVRRGDRHLDVLSFLEVGTEEEIELRRFGVTVAVKLPPRIPIFCVTRIQVVTRHDGTVAVFQRMTDLLADFDAPVQMGEDALLTLDLRGLLTQGMLAWANNVLLRPDETRQTDASKMLDAITELFGDLSPGETVSDLRFLDHDGSLWLAVSLHPASTTTVTRLDAAAATTLTRLDAASISTLARAWVDVRGVAAATTAGAASSRLSMVDRAGVESIRLNLGWSGDAPEFDVVDPLHGGLIGGISGYLAEGLAWRGEVVISAAAFEQDGAVELRLRPGSTGDLEFTGHIDGRLLEQELNRLVRAEIASGTGDTRFSDVSVAIDGDALHASFYVEKKEQFEIDLLLRTVRISTDVGARLSARFRPAARDGVALLDYTGFNAARDLHEVRVSDTRLPGDVRNLLGDAVRGHIQDIGDNAALRLSKELQDELRRCVGQHRLQELALNGLLCRKPHDRDPAPSSRVAWHRIAA